MQEAHGCGRCVAAERLAVHPVLARGRTPRGYVHVTFGGADGVSLTIEEAMWAAGMLLEACNRARSDVMLYEVLITERGYSDADAQDLLAAVALARDVPSQVPE